MDSLLLPLFPLELVLFPGQVLPLHIFEERYKEMIGQCLQDHTEFGVVLVKENAIVNVGCTAHIIEVTKRYDDGRMDISTSGQRRFEVLFLDQEKECLRAAIQFFDDEESVIDATVRGRALELYSQVLELIYSDPQERCKYVADPQTAQLSFTMAGALPVDLDFKQFLLNTRSEAIRLSRIVEYFEKLAPRLKLAARVRSKAGGNGQGR